MDIIKFPFLPTEELGRFRALCKRVVSPEEVVGMFLKMVKPTESRKYFVSFPYIKGVTEPLTRVLKKHDVTVVNKPFTTATTTVPSSEIPISSMESQTTVVYKIPCKNTVRGVTLGKPAELLISGKKEHLRNTTTAAKGSKIAN